jgi:hypothetical protein
MLNNSEICITEHSRYDVYMFSGSVYGLVRTMPNSKSDVN